MRPSQRKPDEVRSVIIRRKYTKHAEGSVLIEFGDTHVLCNATVSKGRPRWMRDQNDNRGWITAEYGMLPRSTGSRMRREAASGKQSGRTQEIQRLIARSLRACVDLELLGDFTITVDCDVIQADGGTRTASITGACVALRDAINHMLAKGVLEKDPFKQYVAAISVGIYENTPVMDLDYAEDSRAETDMNIVMTESGQFIELQGTAEAEPFSAEQLQQMLDLADQGIRQLVDAQRVSIEQNLKHLGF